jgi:mannosyltransferase OCH1-like enzyme
MWVGTRLSSMEQLCAASFMAHGHEFHLYTYGTVEGIPPGVVVKDANEILPQSDIQRFKHLAQFADLFRYKLLFEKGGWWVDMDTVCLKPFDFTSSHVFTSANPLPSSPDQNKDITNCFIKAAKGSLIMKWCLDQSQKIASHDMAWGAIGPALITRAITNMSAQGFVQPVEVFSFINSWEWETTLKTPAVIPSEGAYAIHLFHENWRLFQKDADVTYPSGCLFEQLKWRYLDNFGNHVIQGLWIGDFTAMEAMCIRSFLANGHAFHLYTYEPLEGVPEGTILKDASEIVPKDKIWDFASISNFADYFRYALLSKKGGWWSDMDTICLKPFDFTSEYFFCKDNTNVIVAAGTIKCPPNSPIMKYCFDFVAGLSRQAIFDCSKRTKYQALGPDLLNAAVPKFGLTPFVRSGITCYPINWELAAKVIDSKATWDLTKSYSLHLYHSVWNGGIMSGIRPEFSKVSDSNAKYPDGCLYEQLKRKYSKPPKASIVITTFNRHNQLRNTLESIVAQAYKDYEVIVVDDGLDEETHNLCCHQSYGVEYIRSGRTQSAYLRNPSLPNNIGIRHAKGDVIILQNAECKHIDPNTIEKLVRSVTDTNAVFAMVLSLDQKGGSNQAFPVYCSKKIRRPLFFCGAIKKAWFDKLRGFDEDYTETCYEDDDFSDRLKQEKVVFDFSDIEVHHQWHERAGREDRLPQMRDLYARKTAEMAAGTIGTVRNLNREWGSPVQVFTPAQEVPVPKLSTSPIHKRNNGPYKYAKDGLTINWWDRHTR